MRALWSDRQNCSQNVSQNVKRIRRLSESKLAKKYVLFVTKVLLIKFPKICLCNDRVFCIFNSNSIAKINFTYVYLYRLQDKFL